MILLKDVKKKKIAKKMGVDPGMISHYINGEKLPRVDRAIRMAKALGCSVEDLFTTTGVKESKDERAGKADQSKP